jgi:hypothetical protein
VVEQHPGAFAIGLGDNPLAATRPSDLVPILAKQFPRGNGMPLYSSQNAMMALSNADTSAYPKAAAAALRPPYFWASAETLWL